MKLPFVVAALAGVLFLGGAALFVEQQVSAASYRLKNPTKAAESAAAEVAIADHADAPYCTPKFKEVLSRVVTACGLGAQDARRGCEPVDVRSFATISDADFNALFDPLVERGAIVLFNDDKDDLDAGAKKLIAAKWEERQLARYFFIVARASKKGSAGHNEQLSQRRANSVFFHLEEIAKEKDKGKAKAEPIDNLVGMLWLGSEYAQLSKDYCTKWQNSRPSAKCNDEAVNRSAFVSWVDCRL